MKKKGYFKQFEKVVDSCGIIIEVVDARFPESKSPTIEKVVRRKGKKHLVVLMKADLLRRRKLDSTITSMDVPCLVVSAKKRVGKAKLMKVLHTMAEGRDARVGIVGFPNVGKSSLVNYLVGRHSARVSPIAGHTRGIQWVRLSSKLLLMDTAGVVPSAEGKAKLAMHAAVSVEDLSDPLPVAFDILRRLMSKNKTKLLRFYDIGEKAGDEEDILEKVAIRRGKLLPGGLPNLFEAAKLVIRDWQSGNIRI